MFNEIEALEKKLVELKQAKKSFEFKPIEIQIATKLHECLCTYNHTDGCGWFYREHDWEDSTHKDYLRKAAILLDFAKFYSIKPDYVVDLIAEIK